MQTIKDSDSKWESASGIHKRIGQDVSQTVNQMPTQPEQKFRKTRTANTVYGAVIVGEGKNPSSSDWTAV